MRPTLLFLVACGSPSGEDSTSILPDPQAAIYWTDKDAGALGWLDVETGEAFALVEGLPDPRGIVVHDGVVYWTDAELGVLQSTVDGSEVQVVEGGLTEPADLVRVDGDWLIANRGAGEILRIGALGRSVVAGEGTEPYFLDVARGSVWWGEFDSPTIWSAALDGGETEVAVPAVARVRAVRVTDAHVYWTDREAGTVHRQALGGGPIELLFHDQGTPHGLAILGDALFWTDTTRGEIRTGPVDGGWPEVVMDGLRGPWDLFAVE